MIRFFYQGVEWFFRAPDTVGKLRHTGADRDLYIGSVDLNRVFFNRLSESLTESYGMFDVRVW